MTSGVPRGLALELRGKYGLTYFVETGTYTGVTTKWASDHFDWVVTIEIEENHYEHAVNLFSNRRHVQCLLGDSRYMLRDVLERLKEADELALIFLDAHWGRYMRTKPIVSCPVLDEIKIINEFNEPHIIIVDDARLFNDPDKREASKTEDWPTGDQVVRALHNGGKRLVSMSEKEDYFLAEPLVKKEMKK